MKNLVVKKIVEIEEQLTILEEEVENNKTTDRIKRAVVLKKTNDIVKLKMQKELLADLIAEEEKPKK